MCALFTRTLVQRIQSEGLPSAVLLELPMLRELQHRNIVKLRDYLLVSKRLTLVYEFVFADRDLKQYMAECDGILASDLVMSYMGQLLKGLEYCHTQGLTHGDLKPQALLVSPNGQLKIANFGLAKAANLSTSWYKAPEKLLGVDTYTAAMDMWSTGTILAEMISNRPLFSGDSEIDVLYRTFHVQVLQLNVFSRNLYCCVVLQQSLRVLECV
jgi:cyclin-dependent kinase